MPGMATEEELAELRGLTGTAFDVEFLRLMIRHHQGGLEMAEYAAEHADVAAVRGSPPPSPTPRRPRPRPMTDAHRAGRTPLPAP